MQENQNENVFYGIYNSGKMSINLESAEPFFKALNRVLHIYIVPCSVIERFNHGPGCGLVVDMARYRMERRKYVMYIAEDLPHSERLITIAHELIHLILTMQGFSFERQWLDEKSEPWIEEIAKRFYQANPNFLNWVYRDYVRIAG
ncbi:MAG: ImmA/IrrE family metallo-endopeptidase [Candidatus Paceibacterota bacterium]|jgi:hypothetical protein